MADSAHSFGIKRHDRSGSQAEQLYSQAKVAAGDATDLAGEGFKRADDFLRNHIERSPLLVAASAFAVGWLLGRFGSSGS
jgi:hypothetical protein